MILFAFWVIAVLSAVFYSILHPVKLTNQKYLMVFLFLFLFVVLGWCRGAYDVEIGISRYVDYERMESFTELGFNLLVRLFHLLGINYRWFYIFCSFFEILSIFWFAKKNCEKVHIAVCLFMVFPFVIFFQYLRTLTAIPFVLLALDALINRSRNYVFKYVAFCLLAASFHFASLFFLLYLPAAFLNRTTLSIGTIIGLLIIMMASSLSFFYNLVFRYLGSEKVRILENSVNATGTIGRIAGMAISIMFFFFVFYLLRFVYKIKLDQYIDELYWKINCLSFLCIPLVLNFGVGFSRVPTLIYLFNYPYLVNKISEISDQKKRICVYSIICVYLIGLLYINYHNVEYRELVLYPFFKQNELVNWFIS